jgi:hypothetical protein
MKSLCAFVFFALVLAGPVLSQQKPDASTVSNLPPTTTQVVKFMEVMQVRQRIQSAVKTEQDQTKTVVHNMFHKALPDATPAERAEFEEIVASEFDKMFSDYPLDDVLRDMVPIYQSHFSESDLDQILAFYTSPIGQKVLKAMPSITAEAGRVSMSRLQPKIDKVMENVSTRIAAMSDANRKKEPPKPQ